MSQTDRYEQFVTLLIAHQRRILGYIRTQVPRFEDAEDLMQQTSVVLWRKFATFEAEDISGEADGAAFAAWAFRVARYEVLNHWSKEDMRRRVFSARTLDQLADEAAAMAERDDERRAALAECMERLNERDRRIIEMRYAQSQAPRSIAAAVGQSLWAVYRSLNRIHHGLLDCIEKRMTGGAS